MMADTSPTLPWLSIIMPVLNEEALIESYLKKLQPLRNEGVEIIVVDGGSRDRTMSLARPYADIAVSSAPGRGRQMNAGARRAGSQWLMFLHADTQLPPLDQNRWRYWLGLGQGSSVHRWGRFDVRLSANGLMYRVIAWFMNARSRLTGIATGDQAIFVEKHAFESVGGFAEIELMEDIELSKRLKALDRPLCLRHPVLTSSRRWEENGIVRTITLMWALRLAYFMGVPPKTLAGIYR